MRKLIAIFSLLVFVSCCDPFSFDCVEDLLKEVPSPNNKYTIALFRRNCGATTAFNYHLNLRETKRPFKVDGVHRIEEGFIPTPENEDNFDLTWISDLELEIRCPSCANIERWNDVDIIYVK